MIEFREVPSPDEKSIITEAILRKLPDWFGIEESIIEYIGDVARLYFLCAFDNEKPVGFIAIHEHFPSTCEIHVMGILQSHHRLGIGRELVQRAAAHYAGKCFAFMTVKTVAEPAGNAEYASTRAFYKALGFLPLEVFPLLWDERNPCLLMCKSLAQREGGFSLPDNAS